MTLFFLQYRQLNVLIESHIKKISIKLQTYENLYLNEIHFSETRTKSEAQDSTVSFEILFNIHNTVGLNAGTRSRTLQPWIDEFRHRVPELLSTLCNKHSITGRLEGPLREQSELINNYKQYNYCE